MINIKKKEDCCGCSACAERCPKQCIFMAEDKEGFLYPVVDSSRCISCELCKKVCPVINQDPAHPPIETYASKNQDDNVRLESSSGGIFSNIAKCVLDKGGVVFGAKFNDKWEVEHDYALTGQDLACLRGSKYVQSRMNDNFKKIEKFLNEGKEVLFSGTPCQIAGLRRYLRREYDNLLLVDVICHGVPSPRVWRDYLREYLLRSDAGKRKKTVLGQLSLKDIIAISFRDKSTGWKKYGFVALINSHRQGGKKSDGLISSQKTEILLHEKHYDNLFMRGFLANIFLRPSCYACPAKAGKSGSDITLGDFWGISAVIPELDDDKGTSVVMVNSLKGKSYYDSLNTIRCKCNYQTVNKYNPAIEQSVSRPSITGEFWRQYEACGPECAFYYISRKLYKSFLDRTINKIISLLVRVANKIKIKKFFRVQK